MSAAAPGLAARKAAAVVVSRVLDGGEGEDLLDAVFAAEARDLDDRDRAFARAIVLAALRRLGSIQRVLATFMERGYPRKCGQLEAIMTVAAAQILFMDAPDHAAVDTAISLVRADRNAAPFAGLANAVLRRVAASKDDVAQYDALVDAPDWLATRWRAAWGDERAQAIAAAHRHEAGVDISVRGDAAAWVAQLDGVTLDLAPQGGATTTVRLRSTASIAGLAGYEDGQWWVQDAAAALPARLLGVKPGERVADLCAAPGGKTAQLLAAGAGVTAIDRSPERMERLAANMERLGFAPETRVANVARLDPASLEAFDAVLLDAPCSATGTIRRHPDVAWMKRPADIAALSALQASLLDKAAKLLRPGGRLVYSTCSLEPEEGEAQIAAFLTRNPDMQRLPLAPMELPGLPDAINAEGEVRTFPSMLPDDEARMAGLDGFFAARLQRRA